MNLNPDGLLELARGCQGAAVLAAAADLDLFCALAADAVTAPVLAHRLSYDLRGLTVLLDALTALPLLVKEEDRYSVSPGADACLIASGPYSLLAMSQRFLAEEGMAGRVQFVAGDFMTNTCFDPGAVGNCRHVSVANSQFRRSLPKRGFCPAGGWNTP